MNSAGGEGVGETKVVAAEAPSPAGVILSFAVSVIMGSTRNWSFPVAVGAAASVSWVDRGSSSSTLRMMPAPKGERGVGVAWTAVGVSMVVQFWVKLL